MTHTTEQVSESLRISQEVADKLMLQDDFALTMTSLQYVVTLVALHVADEDKFDELVDRLAQRVKERRHSLVASITADESARAN